MHLLDSKVHALIADYAGAMFLLLSPSLFDFTGAPATLCYAVGAALLGISLLTAYPYGAVKMIPFTAHGVIELVSSLALPATPWLFGFADVERARNYFILAGAVLFAVWAMTDYRTGTRRPAGPMVGTRERSRQREAVPAGR